MIQEIAPKKLHIDVEARRVVYLIETKTEKDTNALETVRTLFAGKPKDFITAVDRGYDETPRQIEIF